MRRSTTRRAGGGHSEASPKPTVRRPGTNCFASTSEAWQSAIPPRAMTRPWSAPARCLKRVVTGRGGDPGRGAGADHPHLQFGDFLERGLDHVLDGADLGCDFKSRGFDDLFAHGSSFPRRGGSRAAPAPGNEVRSRPSCPSSGTGFQARRDTFPPKRPRRSRSGRSTAVGARRSSHWWDGSLLQTAMAGKPSDPPVSARFRSRRDRTPLHGQRAESDD